MASASAADAWQQTGMRSDRAAARSPRPQRGMPAQQRSAVPPRPSAADRAGRIAPSPRDAGRYGEADGYSRPPLLRPSSERNRSQSRPAERDRSVQRRPSARPAGDEHAARAASRTAPEPATGSRLRGAIAVAAVFVVTLAAAALDSFFGEGLGMLTLVALVALSSAATWLVRRRDLLSVVVSPPLVFVAVAAVNVGLAPSASFTLPTIATLLIQGFPTMAVATGAAVVVGLLRWAARR